MKIFERFTSELDGSGEKISEELSEVDLSNPEDVQALIPDHSTEILVHFGEDSFLDRYRRFKEHLPEWRSVYPKLSSVDMRYERQVVLQMPPGTGGGQAAPAGSAANDADVMEAAPHADETVAKVSAKPVVKSAAKTAHVVAKHPATTKPAAKPAGHVPAKKSAPKAKTHVAATKHQPVASKPSASTTQSHPTQVVHP
jgi:cell division protein FtsQ